MSYNSVIATDVKVYLGIGLKGNIFERANLRWHVP